MFLCRERFFVVFGVTESKCGNIMIFISDDPLLMMKDTGQEGNVI